MLALVLVLLSQVTPDSRVSRVERVPGGRMEGGRGGVKGWAFFEAFPVGGAGTFGACSTTPPTGAKGETLTFARTGNAMCSKQGPATTGIANGDLVLLSADVPRVSSVAGLLAFLRESSRTNSCLRSEELGNVVWSGFGTGAAAPTVTSDVATSPRNDTTAERIQIPATTAAQQSGLVQTVGAFGGANFGTLFVRGNAGTSGTIDLLTTAPTTCAACSYVGDSWSRCSVPGSTGTTQIYLGNLSLTCGTARSAADVLVWGVQWEAGVYPSSYTPTTSAAVTRNADSAMSATLTSSVGTSFSLGASTAYLSSSVTTATAVQLGTVAPNLASVGRSSNTAASFTINATSTTPAVSAQGTSMLRGCLTDAAGTRTAWWDGSTVSAPAASMSAGVTALSFGALDAYTARVLVDPSPTRCP